MNDKTDSNMNPAAYPLFNQNIFLKPILYSDFLMSSSSIVAKESAVISATDVILLA